jgi:hypothetical protein
MINSVLHCLTMSVDTGQLDSDAQAREQESPSAVEPPTDATGLRGRLKRHFEQWARLYVEQRVAVRTGVDR